MNNNNRIGMINGHNADVTHWLASQPDDIDRAIAIGWLIERRQEEITRLSDERSALIKRMRSQGRSIRRIAADLGVSSTRIEQLSR